eukprot:2573817-Prymnesium_polylepis.1
MPRLHETRHLAARETPSLASRLEHERRLMAAVHVPRVLCPWSAAIGVGWVGGRRTSRWPS